MKETYSHNKRLFARSWPIMHTHNAANNCNSLLSLSLAYFILIEQMELVDYVAESLKHYDNMFIFLL
jgi:hypothetical protein